MRAYRLGRLARPVTGYLRRFHNRAANAFTPTANQAAELGASGFERLMVLGLGVDAARSARIGVIRNGAAPVGG